MPVACNSKTVVMMSSITVCRSATDRFSRAVISLDRDWAMMALQIQTDSVDLLNHMVVQFMRDPLTVGQHSQMTGAF